MKELIDSPEHAALEATARRFAEKGILPFQDQWEEAREIPRELSKKAAAAGLLASTSPKMSAVVAATSSTPSSSPKRCTRSASPAV